MNPNLNTLAKEIAEEEGLKEQVDIAGIKEVLACLGKILRRKDFFASVDLLIKIYTTAGKKSTKQ
ncbi:MAG: hypothetical protein AABY22_05410 [Nanoarchaeota archaeon]